MLSVLTFKSKYTMRNISTLKSPDTKVMHSGQYSKSKHSEHEGNGGVAVPSISIRDYCIFFPCN